MEHPTIVELNVPNMPYCLEAGLSEFEPGDHHPHRKNLGVYDLLFVLQGELYMGENERRWHLKKGDTLLLAPDGEHYSFRPCETKTVFYWIHFEHEDKYGRTRSENADSTAQSTRPFGNPHTLRLLKQTSLSDPQRAFDRLKQLLAQPIGGSFWVEQRLLLELLELLADNAAEHAPTRAGRLAEQAAAYIRLHYRAKLTNGGIAAALHFHPNYLVRCMKMKYGLTPMDYLQQLRLEQAKRLLLTTEWSVERIAEEVGFRYAPYFSSSFKRSSGRTPLQYRKQFFQ